jgi:D-3-phosphoglycerate dehydrogenase
MPNQPAAEPIHVGFMTGWRPHERQFVRQACPPTLICHFIDDPDKDNALARLDVLVVGTQHVSGSLLASAPRLKLLQRWGTGFDNVDVEHLQSRGIALAELPGFNARSVSEFMVGAMLAVYRHLPEAIEAWANGRWLAGAQRQPAHRLEGKTVGLLGYGAIGQDLARLLAGFSVSICYHDVLPQSVDGVAARYLEKDALLRASDIICVQLPSTRATRGTIGAAEIAIMKQNAVIISVSRGDVVDEHAVREAVRHNRLFGASFDNFLVEPLPAGEIWFEPRILATPHMAGATVEGFEALTAACFSSIVEILKLQPLPV